MNFKINRNCLKVAVLSGNSFQILLVSCKLPCRKFQVSHEDDVLRQA